MTMQNEISQAYGIVVTRAHSDAAFRQRLLAEPVAALAECGIEVPARLRIHVVENTATRKHIVLPPRPAEMPAAARYSADDENPYGKLVARAWNDPGFRHRLASHPADALRECGMAAPEGVEIVVVERTPEDAWLILPV